MIQMGNVMSHFHQYEIMSNINYFNRSLFCISLTFKNNKLFLFSQALDKILRMFNIKPITDAGAKSVHPYLLESDKNSS